MMSKKMKFGGSRDVISGLPEALICHILSFLPTKEAASTSVLAKRWRYLFAYTPNLDFDDSIYLNPDIMEMVRQKRNTVSTSFMDFVDRVLALQGNDPVHKFSLKFEDGYDPVDPIRIFRWIVNVLDRGVSDLSLSIDLESESLLPSKVFLSQTLVRLKLYSFGYGPTIDFEVVHLPKLKTLYLASVHFEKHGVGLSKLLSGCCSLEDLVIDDISWCIWDFGSVCVTTLKRLRLCSEMRDENPESVSIDTPNLVYLEFTDTIADKYPKVNFDSLVEAKIDLRMSDDQIGLARFDEEDDVGANATDFIRGICNVKILYLSADTLEVLTDYCETIPLFNNLTHLTIESNPKVGWQSLPGLLKNSPNLDTLVLQGLVHKTTNRCGDVCLCKRWEEQEEEEEEEEIHTCLSSSPVKVLKIMKFGETYDYEIGKNIKQVKHFLKTMPNLEQLVVYYDTSFEEDVIEVSTQLQRLPKVASSKCKVQIISGHLSLSSTVPSSVSMKWASLP